MIKRFLQKNVLWVGFLAVLLPLAVLLGLQYFWLVDLQNKSAIAEKAYLENYLEAVSSKVEYFYRSQAERAVNITGYAFSTETPKKVVAYFRKREVEGAKLLFAVHFTNRRWPKILVFDPVTGLAGEPYDAATAEAIVVATAPLKTLSHKGSPIQSHGISVEEQDPENRIILSPVSDDGGALLGAVGMVVDNEHFADAVLPSAIDAALPKFFSAGARENLLITVRDSKGALIVGPDSGAESAETTGRIPFIFSDWKLVLGSRYATPEEWAKANFLLNISISALLGLALLGGIVLALRTASREIRLSRMKSDFVSNVSHELRTPLASIRVFGEFLRLGRVKDQEKSREYGEYIETESRRLTQLINNILDFSKIESEAKTYDLEPADLHSVLSDTLKSLEVSLKHKGFRLTFDSPATPIPPVEVDSDAISQAVANLVDNAVKYSDNSTYVRVSLARQDGEALIAVQDHGIGISKEEQTKIFERFHRVASGLVHDVKGSGLGLSIVSHIVQAHGGRVTVESESGSGSGSGSTFTIHLPLQADATQEEGGAPDRGRPFVQMERP